MKNYVIKTAGDIKTIAHELTVLTAVYGKNTKLIDLLKKDGKKYGYN